LLIKRDIRHEDHKEHEEKYRKLWKFSRVFKFLR